MNVSNHHGVPFGTIESEVNAGIMYYRFHPKKGWELGYTAHQLEEIAKQIRKLENNNQ